MCFKIHHEGPYLRIHPSEILSVCFYEYNFIPYSVNCQAKFYVLFRVYQIILSRLHLCTGIFQENMKKRVLFLLHTPLKKWSAGKGYYHEERTEPI